MCAARVEEVQERWSDVCGSSRWERDRALMLERRWKVKVRDFETYGGATLDLMSQCQRGSNRASIIDNVLTCPCVLLRFLSRLRLVWWRTWGLCGILSHVSTLSATPNRFQWTKPLIAAHAGAWERRRGWVHTQWWLLLLLLLRLLLLFCEMLAHLISTSP
jgi:hypothetical protein